jgi:flagella basal body P-ring formation protein FlgA
MDRDPHQNSNKRDFAASDQARGQGDVSLKLKAQSSIKLILWVVAFCWACLSGGPPEAAGPTSVRFWDQAEVAADQILLGRIARVDGTDPQLAAALEAVVLGRSPLPGKTRALDRGTILTRLRQSGIEPAHLDLQIPAEVMVTRAAITIGREQIERIAREYIQQQAAGPGETLRIKDIRVAESVVLPQGQLVTRVLAPRNTELAGTVSLTVVFRVDDDAEKRVWVTVSLERLTKVVTARRPLGRFKPIDAEDLEIKTVDAAGLPADLITDPEVLIGKRTRRPLDSGTVLRHELVELPPIVKNGDRVRIIAETPGLRISALGQVKQKGCQGELIQVMNLDSNKVIYARVIDSQTVRIEF